MAITTTSNTSFGILVNDLESNNYTSSAVKNLIFTLAFINTVTDLKNEANYEISTVITTPVINGTLTINVEKSSLDATAHYLGIRLVSDTSTNANASKLTFTAGSSFSNTPVETSQSTAPASNSNILWSAAVIPQESTGSFIIPLSIKYTGTTPGNSLTYTLELYQTDNISTGTPVLKGTAIATTDTSLPLELTAWSSQVTSAITAYKQDNFVAAPASFAIGEKLALKTNLTTNVNANYKRVSTITTTIVIPRDISLDTDYMNSLAPDYLYVTALKNPVNLAALNTDAADSTDGVTVKVPITTDVDTGVTLTTDSATNTISIAIDSTYYEKVFEAVDAKVVLKTPIDIYVTGTVNAIA